MPLRRQVGTGVHPVDYHHGNTDRYLVNEVPDPHRRRQAWSPRIQSVQVSITEIPGVTSDDVQGALEEISDSAPEPVEVYWDRIDDHLEPTTFGDKVYAVSGSGNF